ncbi:MAG: hypothetical protein ACI9LN_004754 [Saprospiraceae bacterium]|jgi:hypothetical protein
MCCKLSLFLFLPLNYRARIAAGNAHYILGSEKILRFSRFSKFQEIFVTQDYIT